MPRNVRGRLEHFARAGYVFLVTSGRPCRGKPHRASRMIWLALLAAFAFDPTATVKQICTPGYSKAHRHVTYALRDRIYDRDGLPRGSRRGYVIDHRIPIEIGGSNDPSNLFAEPRAEAKRKDRLEDRLHTDVCSGLTTLAAARAAMLRAWAR